MWNWIIILPFLSIIVDQQQTTKRELPKPPVEGGGGEEIKEKKSGTGLRLSNFFRSVKFPRNKKVQTSSNPACRVFGKDLNELAKTTGLEGKCLYV